MICFSFFQLYGQKLTEKNKKWMSRTEDTATQSILIRSAIRSDSSTHTHTRIIESEVLAQCLLVSIMDFHLFDARWLRRQMEISSLFVSAKISRNQLKNITDKIVKLLFLLVSFSFTAQIGRTHGKNIRKNWCGDVDCSVRSDSVHEIFCGVFFYVLATQRQTHLLERLAI